MKQIIRYLLTGFLFGATIHMVMGQATQAEPSMYTSDDGKLYWNKGLPVYLRIASSPEDKGVLLKSEQHQDYVNPLYLDTEGVNYIRTRYAVDPSTKETVTPKVEVLLEVYADGTAPLTRDVFENAPEYISGAKRFIGKNLTVALSSSDKLSGVEQIQFALNDQAYQPFQQAIVFDQEGTQRLRFYAVDHVGNREKEMERNFIVDLSAPTSYHNVNGIAEDYIISLSSTIYFTVEDNLSGVKHTYYRFDDEEYRLYGGKTLQMDYLSDGDHVLQYYSEDHVRNKEEVKELKFYFDKTAPITVADVLGDRYLVDDKVYLSGRTKMKLTAVDNKAGVKEILYSMDGQDFQVYDQPFYLSNISGEHIIKYYSIDNLSNQSTGRGGSGYEEFKHNVSKVYLDLTGPTINFSYRGKNFKTRDTVFINNSTQIKLDALDAESGMQYISYSIDGVSEETKYDSPFTIEESGIHNIEIFGYDNVNNRNVKEFYCLVDGEAPKVITNFSIETIGKKEGLDVYPAYVSLYLAATDKAVGAGNIYYKVNDATEKNYTGAIKGFRKNTKYTILVRGSDLLENENTISIEFYTED